MNVLRRIADARNTVEGKILAVLMAALLAVSMCGTTAWADPATGSSTTAGQAESQPEKAQDPVLSLTLNNGYLVYGAGQIVKAPATKVTAAAGRDFKFVPEADKGYHVASVSYAANGATTELYPNSAGEYAIPASRLVSGGHLTLNTTKDVGTTGTTTVTIEGASTVKGEGPAAAVSGAVAASGEITQEFGVTTLTGDEEQADTTGASSTTTVTKPQPISNGTLSVSQSDTIALKSERGSFAHGWTTSDESVVLVSGDRNAAIVSGIATGTATITHTYSEYVEGGEKWQTTSETWELSVLPATLEVATTPDTDKDADANTSQPENEPVSDEPQDGVLPATEGDDAEGDADAADQKPATTRVYVYMTPSDDADITGWARNADGTYTLGWVNVATDKLPELAVGGSADFDSVLAIGNALSALDSYASRQAADVDLSQIGWDTLDYEAAVPGVGAQGPAWALRGTLFVTQDATHTLTVDFAFHEGDGDAPQLPEPLVHEGLKYGTTYSIATGSIPVLDGYVADYASDEVVITGDMRQVVTYHRDANGNGIPDCREFRGTVTMAGWTYGQVSPSPVGTVILGVGDGSVSRDEFGDPRFEYKPAGASDDAYTEDRPVDAGDYIVRATWISENYGQLTDTDEFTIAKRHVVLTSASDSRDYNGEPLTNGEVIVTGDGWAVGEDATYDVTGTITNVGSTPNAFTYTLAAKAKADNYTVETHEGTLTVNRIGDEEPITVFANSAAKPYDGRALTAQEAGFSYSPQVLAEGDRLEVTLSGSQTDAGVATSSVVSYRVMRGEGDAAQDVTSNYQFAGTRDGVLTVDKRQVILTSANAFKAYDGQELVSDVVTVGGEGWAEGQGADYDVTGTQTEIGFSDNAFTYALHEGTNPDNYEVTCVFGTLAVGSDAAEHEITIQADSATVRYDGTTHVVDGLSVVRDEGDEAEGLGALQFQLDGMTYTVSGLAASGSGIDAGEYTVNVVGTPVIMDANGDDCTAQFTIKPACGTLTIAKRTVSLLSVDAEKVYDETALTADRVKVYGDGWAAGEGADCVVTGSQTAVGFSPNAFTYTLWSNTKASNYLIDTAFGTLTVVPADADYSIVLIPNVAEPVKYDGQAHTVEGFTVQGSGRTDASFTAEGKTYTVTGVTISATGTDAGTYAARVEGSPVVRTATGDDFTGRFAVRVQPATTLEITKRSVTLTGRALEKPYDGTPLVNGDGFESTPVVGGDGWAAGEGANFVYSGSQTLVGTSPNTFTYTAKPGTKLSNYDITTAPGTLTVTNRDAKYEVTVRAQSGSLMYNGREQQLTGLVGETDVTLQTAEGPRAIHGVMVSANGLPFYVTGLSASGAGKDVNASGYAVTVTGEPTVYDLEGNDVTEQFSVRPEAGTLTIEKRPLTLTSATLTHEFDGAPLSNGSTPLAVEEGWADGEGATYEFTAQPIRKLGDVADNTFTIVPNANTNLNNYDINVTVGQLRIINPAAPYTLTLQANSLETLYDGQEHSVSGFEGQDENGTIFVKLAEDGATFRVTGLTSHASATHATVNKEQGGLSTTIETDPAGVFVFDEDGNNVSNLFNVVPVAGKLLINPRQVTLTSADLEKPYDGTPLVNGEEPLQVGGDGFVGEDGVDVTFTGSQTLRGQSANSFTYRLNASAGADDYVITCAEGSLTVTPPDAAVRLELGVNSNDADAADAVYDGKPHTVAGFAGEQGSVTTPAADDRPAHEVSGIWVSAPNGVRYLVNVDGYVAERTETNAGTYPVIPTGTYYAYDEQGNDVTEQVAVIARPGTLTISQRPVDLLSNTDAKVYDGAALMGTSVTATNEAEGEGWVEGEQASFQFLGSLTNVGSVDNRFGFASNATTNVGNYRVTTSYGTLSVVPQSLNPDDPREINPDDLTQAVYAGASVQAPAPVTYNGQAQELEPVVTAPNGLTLRAGIDYTITYVGDTTAASANSADGAVQMILSAVESGNFRGTVTCDYEILPAPVTIIVNPAAKVFGDDDPQNYGSYAVRGLFGNDTLGAVTLTRLNDAEDAGTYEGVIDATVDVLNGNYRVESVQRGDFTISPYDGNVLTLNYVAGADSFTKTYDGRPAVVQASALQPGSTVWFSADGTLQNWTTDPTDFVDAGTYQVFVQATHPNFAPTEPMVATVVINPATATITVDSASKAAGEADPEFTGTVTGLVAGDQLENVSYTRTGDDEAVGTYPNVLTASYYPDDNYNVRVVPGTFTITVPQGLLPTPLTTGPVPGQTPDDGPLATVVDLLSAPIEMITGNETPLAETAIDDDANPLGAFDHPLCWIHFYVYLGIVLTLVYGAACVVRRLRNTRDITDFEDTLTGRRRSEPTVRAAEPATRRVEL